jgi:hypothetical protein
MAFHGQGDLVEKETRRGVRLGVDARGRRGPVGGEGVPVMWWRRWGTSGRQRMGTLEVGDSWVV